MAHKRVDTLVPPPERWRHLRPELKRRVAKAERRAARRALGGQLGEDDPP
jgi:hypothetical protein